MTSQTLPAGPQWFGHPRGLFVCFATEMWERFSFYGMKYLLVLFLVQHHLFTDGEALRILGSYAALGIRNAPIGRRDFGSLFGANQGG
jgi:POT family proton-dependent oligopeptide transporter